MTDKELLEAAAIAAGHDVARWSDKEDALLLVGVQEPWNPLLDDGDALRLACSLKLNIAQGDFSARVDDEGGIDEASLVRNDGERAKVVRRLIVTAAAAMAAT